MHTSCRAHLLACLAAAVAFAWPIESRAAPTDLDPSFGSAGIARLPASVWIGQLASYPDGRLVLLLADRTASPYAQSIIRLDPCGHSDGSMTPVGPLTGCSINAIAVSADGRLATLQSLLQAPNGATWVTRHLPDGSLDSAFGQSGSVLVARFHYDFHARYGVWGEFSRGLTADASGRLYTSTELQEGTSISATWITSIGASGYPVEQLNRSTVATRALRYGPIRIDANGGVVALLHSYERLVFGGPVVGGPALVRLIDGVPDRRFGLGGVAFHPVSNWLATLDGHGVYDLATTPDGGYVVLGATRDEPVVVVKFTATGDVDAAFGKSGIAPVVLARPGEVVQNAKLAAQPDGRVVVAGTISDGGPGLPHVSVGLGRLTPGGNPDLLFAGGGIASFGVERGAAADSVSVRPDGRILVVGAINAAGAPYPAQSALFQFLGGNATRVRPFRERQAIEYVHAGAGHYFLTADAHEIAALDFGPGDWVRTGHAIRVWDDADASLAPVCRFWSGQSFAPRSSHFYTPYPDECAKVRQDPAWLFERYAFHVMLPEGPPGSRGCPAGAQALYRAYNNGQGGAPNHRYTTAPTLLDGLIAQGWTMEGEAATRVFACVPRQD